MDVNLPTCFFLASRSVWFEARPCRNCRQDHEGIPACLLLILIFCLSFQVESGANEQNYSVLLDALSLTASRTSSTSSEHLCSTQLVNHPSFDDSMGPCFSIGGSLPAPLASTPDERNWCPLMGGAAPKTPTMSEFTNSNRSSMTDATWRSSSSSGRSSAAGSEGSEVNTKGAATKPEPSGFIPKSQAELNAEFYKDLEESRAETARLQAKLLALLADR